MVNVVIDSNMILFDSIAVNFSINYDLADMLFADICENKMKPNNDFGYVKINNVEFYGLKGICTLWFNDYNLEKIEFEQDWLKYNLYNNITGNRKSTGDLSHEIADISRNTLKQTFGDPSIIEKPDRETFVLDSFKVITQVAIDENGYNITIEENI